MSKFDYESFDDGCCDTEFVVHAKKYTKEEAVELFIKERLPVKDPTIDDVMEGTVRWYPKIPEWCSYDEDVNRGCYTYCAKGERGSFPVWIIGIDGNE